MLIIRWTYQYGDTAARREITEPEFNQIYNEIYSLGDGIRFEGQDTSNVFESFFRRTLFHQLPFQLSINDVGTGLSRQMVMFCELGQPYGIEQEFERITGLTASIFLELYFACWACLKAGNPIWLDLGKYAQLYPNNEVARFYELLAKDFANAQAFIRDYTANPNKVERKNIQYQINEHTPLERYPLYKTNGRYMPYSIMLFNNAMLNNMCDIFKADNPNFSSTSFGKIFESYVGKGVALACSDFIAEDELKKLVPKNSKVADFLVREDNAAIIIEAKSTEQHEVARIYQTKEALLFNIKSNPIFKSLLQVITTAHHLKAAGHLKPENRVFALIPTYKDYLIGPPRNFWDNIIGEEMTRKLQELGLTNHISPEDIFYVSIADFDYLMAGAAETGVSIGTLLAQIVERNRSPETMGIMLNQHLKTIWRLYYRPPYLDASLDKCAKSIERRFANA
ncbi:MAG: hypothetical protein DI582_10885 [Azospirillum brasilense]|nr:MAG: hypothetical protein DI582_10885 [Azospirillum brasilense]